MPEKPKLREGYELWRPNRVKAHTKLTKLIVALVLFASAALLAIITLGGWERLQGGSVGGMTLLWAGLYVIFGLLVLRWNRGLLPVSASLAMIMTIFAAIAATSWFQRDKTGLDSPAIPEDILGLLTMLVIPVQLLLIGVAMYAFNQNWHVEEERPIEGYDHGDEGEKPDYPSGSTPLAGESA